MQDQKIYDKPFEHHDYDAPYWFSRTFPNNGKIVVMCHPSLEAAVARVERVTGKKEWEMYQKGWKISGTLSKATPANQRTKVHGYLNRKLSKKTNSRRKSMIQHWNLNPETTWPELMDVLATEDEMIFQMKLSTLREKYGTKPS